MITPEQIYNQFRTETGGPYPSIAIWEDLPPFVQVAWENVIQAVILDVRDSFRREDR